jgi:hypothetical protein
MNILKKTLLGSWIACGSLASIQQHAAMKVEPSIGFYQTLYISNFSEVIKLPAIVKDFKAGEVIGDIRSRLRYTDIFGNICGAVSIDGGFTVQIMTAYSPDNPRHSRVTNSFAFYFVNKKNFFLSPILFLGETSKTSGLGILWSLFNRLIHASLELKLSFFECLVQEGVKEGWKQILEKAQSTADTLSTGIDAAERSSPLFALSLMSEIFGFRLMFQFMSTSSVI